MMLHQVEFLIEGHLLPMTMGEMRVSENLLLQQAWKKETGSWLSDSQTFHTLAYVSVETEEVVNYFPIAIDYLNFFLLIYTLASSQPVTAKVGIGTTLDDVNLLGEKRIGFPSFEKIHISEEHTVTPLDKLILEVKGRFLLLLPDKQRIMKSYLGLALTHYYNAVQATRRQQRDAITNLMSASEALLIVRGEKISSSLSRRLSSLIAKNETEKTEISRKMRELYDLRSGIVHGERKKPTLAETSLLFSFVNRAISRAISLRKLTKGELLEELDKKIL